MNKVHSYKIEKKSWRNTITSTVIFNRSQRSIRTFKKLTVFKYIEIKSMDR